MPFTPDPPFPKSQGDTVRSKDWNDAINELLRLDTAKVNKAGDAMTGPLTVQGNVGIGTTGPAAKLHVLSVEPHARIESSGDRALIVFAKAGAPQWDFGVGRGAGDNDFWFGDMSAYRMVLQKGTGNVGIGTATPTHRVDIKGDTRLRAAANTNLLISKTGAFDDDVAIDFIKDTNTTPSARIVFDGFTDQGVHRASLRFSTRGASDTNVVERMQITEDGNVGIGTPAPTHKFHVLAADAVGLFESSGTQAYLRLSTNEGIGNRVEITNRPGGRLSLWTAGFGDALNILRDGNVGIGTTTPQGKLDVIGDIRAGNSDIYFTKTNHNHTGIGNTAGFAAIENAANYDALMILGRAGTSKGRYVRLWDYLQVVGNMDITGNLGTHGYSPTPRTSGWGGGIHTFDIEAEGTIWSRSVYKSGPRDLAENYSSDIDLEPGDVVCIDKKKDRLVLSEKPNDILVLGVISTSPGFLLNVNPDIKEEEGKAFPVALSGRVPCKVVDENGPIKRGDLLTASSTPGHAMKATPIKINGDEFYRPGTIIGKALGSLKSGKGKVDIFIFMS